MNPATTALTLAGAIAVAIGAMPLYAGAAEDPAPSTAPMPTEAPDAGAATLPEFETNAAGDLLPAIDDRAAEVAPMGRAGEAGEPGLADRDSGSDDNLPRDEDGRFAGEGDEFGIDTDGGFGADLDVNDVAGQERGPDVGDFQSLSAPAPVDTAAE